MRKALLAVPFSIVLTGILIAACGDESTSKFDPSGSSGDGGNTSSGSTSGGCGFGGCPDPDGGGSSGLPPCEGVKCAIKKCDQPGQTQKTTLSGKVYDPAGKVPIYNVVVYVTDPKFDTLKPITAGLGEACDRCDGKITGIVEETGSVLTDASGSFKLENVPAGIELNLVMQIGKWRRVVKIPATPECTTQDLTANKDLMRLPRNHTEGDLPKIAISTGGSDPMECLFRKIGIDASEFGTAGDDAEPSLKKIHLYHGGSTPSTTPPQIATKEFTGGKAFASSSTQLWNSVDKLKAYDIVVLACEGGENDAEKPVAARQALYDYAKVGGRIFSSHFHHYWFSGSPVADVKNLATWTNNFTCPGVSPNDGCSCGGPGITTSTEPVTAQCALVREPQPDVEVQATINTSFAKGAAMKQWLSNTGSLTVPGDTLKVQEMRHNVDAITPSDPARLLSWMTVQNPAAGNRVSHEYVSFNTPVGAADNAVCGRVVYSDLHVVPSAQPNGDKTNKPFPEGCVEGAELTPQQKALEFMLFDLASCIQPDRDPVIGPK